MINKALFEKFGLNNKEISIYLFVLSSSDSGVREIERNTSIGRTHVYDISRKLIEKGFLTQIEKDKKKVFNAVSPKEILENQKNIVSEFEEMLDELIELQKTDSKKPKIVYYSGKKELEKMHENLISFKIDKEAIAFGDEAFYLKNEGSHQKKEIDKRLKEKVRFRALAGMSNAVLDSQKNDDKENRETRIFPKEIFDLKSTIGAHGNKTIVVNNNKEFGFVVEDEDLAETIKKIFEIAWNSGRVIQ